MQHHVRVRWLFGLVLCGSFLPPAGAHAQTTNGAFRVQWGPPPPAPVTLVAHDDFWHYRRGTNAPQADWATTPDSGLDATWAVAQGGFGFGDPGIVGENTTINIANVCSTLYLRRTFAITEPLDPEALLRLKVDYDDGFVAYLDGVEIARANLTNGPGTFVPHTATTGARSHEASCCNAPTNPPEIFEAGPVGGRLEPGEHVLAIIAVNQSLASSDLHLIADLYVDTAATAEVHGEFFSLAGTRSLMIAGVNEVAGSRRVVLNGDDIAWSAETGEWQTNAPLSPGVNTLTLQALDAAGRVLAETNRRVIVRSQEILVGGLLEPETVWRRDAGLIRLTNTVVLPPNGSLTIEPGVIILMGANCSVRGTNALLSAEGTPGAPILWLPANGSNTNWGGLSLSGTNGALTLRHVEILGGFTQLRDGATGLLEDCYLHDYHTASPAIVHTLGSPNLVVIELRRCHIARYHETLFQLSLVRIEDSLLEYLDYSGDGIDFDGARPGSWIRRTTVRRGTIYNTDALDIGEYSPAEPSRGVLIADCLLHDFVDKGVSLGAYVEATISNCVLYNVESGIAVKDSSLAGVFHTTVAAADYGIRNYNKANPNASTGGGDITNAQNNIFWDLNLAAVSLLNGSTLTAEYSSFQNTNWPGAGNVDLDPWFRDPARHDYRLSTNSPLLTAGRDGAPMGAQYPVGGLPAAPLRLAALHPGPGAVTLEWEDDADNEDDFEIQRSPDRVSWKTIGTAPAEATEYVDAQAPPNLRAYYRVRARNDAGVSPWSTVAGATPLGAPQLTEPHWQPATGFGLRLSAPSGAEVVLEGSSDFREWLPVVITNAPGGSLELWDPEGPQRAWRFYRVRVTR